MQFVEFREIIRKRATIEDEWYTEVEKCWNEMADLFTADIEKTILFLDVCTGDEFSWMSEVFEEVSKRVLSRDFIAALRRTASKYPKETQQYNIIDFIDSAECIIDNAQA